ncbi:hypothetical protein H6G89_18640 [Oscillatoria sp. FACHB-1407]|nr:hypothetical protein [Oscillatoria sp. FACHB-1407]
MLTVAQLAMDYGWVLGSSRLRAIARASLTAVCSSNLGSTHLLKHLLAIG